MPLNRLLTAAEQALTALGTQFDHDVSAGSRVVTAVRTAFVMEQTLGHVTHYRNLQEVTADQADVDPHWVAIPFEAGRRERLVPLLGTNWSVRASWRARNALNSLLRRQALDVLFFHTQVTALFARSIMRRVPAVISLDATPINYDSVGEYYGHRAAGGGFMDRRKHSMNRAAFHAAAALIAWSDWARRSLIHDYGVDGRMVHVISPGAGSAFFDIGRLRFASSLQKRRERVRLLFVGGNFERKGGRLLLEAWHGPLADRCELDIVTNETIEVRQPNVRVHTGVAPNSSALRQLFSDADVFVLPTHADCLALVLMEAAAAGLPVVATTVGALSEAFNSDASGLAIPTNDVPALRAALLALARDPELRQRLGRAGHELARQRFDARQNNRALLDVVRSVAHERRSTERAA